jgi:LppP/LprE lipoprotein
VLRAVQLVEPISQWPLDANSAWGNFDPCAYLSVALIPTAMGTGSSPVQALMFHYGDYVGSPTGSGVGYLGFSKEKTTDRTVVLIYRATRGSCGACDDATYADVRYQLQDGRIVALDPIPHL